MTAPRIRTVAAFATGLLFAIGLCVSGMTRPSKVLGFLDLAGGWDPSLACVMGAALAVTVLAFPLILRRARPLLDSAFHLPAKSSIDRRLVGGAVLFGVGWGIAGYCPGPALVTAATGNGSAVIFTVAMLVGMGVFAWGSRG